MNPSRQPSAHGGASEPAGSPASTDTGKSPAGKPARGARRAHWPWLLAALLLILGLFVWSFDELPPDVGDLAIERLNLKDDENAYVLLKQVGEDAMAALNLDAENRKRFSLMVDGEEWDDARAEAWIAAVRPLWPRYEKAAHTMTSEISAADLATRKFSIIGPLNDLARLSHLRARYDLRAGHPDEALAHALLAIDAADRLAQSRSSLVGPMVSAGIKSMTLELVDKILRNPNVSNEALRALISSLEFSNTTAPFDQSVRAEFDEGVFWIDKFEREGDDLLLELPKGWSRLGPFVASIPILYKRNKTLRIHAQEVRAVRKGIGGNLEAIRRGRKSLNVDHVGEGLAALNPDNIFGRKVLNAMNPGSFLSPGLRLRPGTKTGALQALAAALLYQREHGTVPPSLEALVPRYLPAVPIDLFDDAPLRYSADLGVIWSTGEKGLIINARDQEISEREIVAWIVPPPPKRETPSDETRDSVEITPATP